jgi:hypothetical protein
MLGAIIGRYLERQALPDCKPNLTRPQTGNAAGFSLHTGVATAAGFSYDRI